MNTHMKHGTAYAPVAAQISQTHRAVIPYGCSDQVSECLCRSWRWITDTMSTKTHTNIHQSKDGKDGVRGGSFTIDCSSSALSGFVVAFCEGK